GPLYGGQNHFSYGADYDGPRKASGVITDPGAITDDTTLRHYLCLCIVNKGGRVTPDDYAQTWVTQVNPNRLWINEKIIHHKLKLGMNPWDTGKGTPPAGVATMSIAPIGIVNAGNPRQAYQDAFNIGFVNQDNENRDGAATIAAGVAAAFLPGATPERVIDAMLEHSSYVIRRALVLTLDLVEQSNGIEDFAKAYYEHMLDWTWPTPTFKTWDKNRYFSGSSIELVPITAAMLKMFGQDVNHGIIEAASFGRDNDTTASLVGSIAGIMQGASALRPEWIETVEAGNADFFAETEGDASANFLSVAKRLVTVLQNEQQASLEQSQRLTEILGRTA
ncbi:MAG: ADP-ribosylglycohydrolase family protein, partial [Deinococcota bacterium]